MSEEETKVEGEETPVEGEVVEETVAPKVVEEETTPAAE